MCYCQDSILEMLDARCILHAHGTKHRYVFIVFIYEFMDDTSNLYIQPPILSMLSMQHPGSFMFQDETRRVRPLPPRPTGAAPEPSAARVQPLLWEMQPDKHLAGLGGFLGNKNHLESKVMFFTTLRVRISDFFDLQGELPNRTRLVSCYFDVFTPKAAADEIAVETVVFKGRVRFAKPWYRRLVGEYNNRLFAGISINRPVYKDFNQFGLLDTHMD